MASKLTKFAQKVFGSQAGLNQHVKFGSLAAGSPEFVSIDGAQSNANSVQSLGNYLVGWYAATINGASPAKQDMNSLFWLVTRQLAYIFQSGVPEWDSSTEYFIGSYVNVAGVQYVSKIDNNIGQDPTTNPDKWRLYSSVQTGFLQPTIAAAAPAGYVLASGRTIGNGSSNATERASNDTFELFTLLWNGYTDAQIPMKDSAGAPSTRGGSALLDWNANKQITLPDLRDRTIIGKGNMGGTAASRITSAMTGLDTTVLGAAGGAQSVVLSAAQLPPHTHSGTTGNDYPDHVHYVRAHSNDAGNGNAFSDGGGDGDNGVRATTGTNTRHVHDFTTGNGNGLNGDAHANVQPSFVANVLIKL